MAGTTRRGTNLSPEGRRTLKARMFGAAEPFKDRLGAAAHLFLGYVAATHPQVGASITLAFLLYQYLDYKRGEPPEVTMGDVVEYVTGILAGLGLLTAGVNPPF